MPGLMLDARWWMAGLVISLVLLPGCAITKKRVPAAKRAAAKPLCLPATTTADSVRSPLPAEGDLQPQKSPDPVTQMVAYSQPQGDANSPSPARELHALQVEAQQFNPRLRRLSQEAAAAWARVPQVRSLPDPMIEGRAGEPTRTAGGDMHANLMIRQTIPFLRRLNAQGQQAAFEALMLEQEVLSARLRITADVEEAWYRLYLLGQLLRINEDTRRLISSLVEVATGQVEVGTATPGDVVLGTLELSRIEEERLTLEQQLASRRAALNELLNRPSDAPMPLPMAIDDAPVEQSLDGLRALAFERQPEIIAARLRTQATAWGVRIARWERVPDVTVSYEHMFLEPKREMGPDPWRVGLEINVPLWRRKYVAMEQEARRQNLAASRQIEEAVREYDSRLLDLLEQARTAERTSRLYRDTILPQARQVLEADQRAYAQGEVTFERVINDAQNLLTAESAWHRAMTDQAIAVARLKQAAGGDLPATVEEDMEELLPLDQGGME